MLSALHAVFQALSEIVAQIVEAEFVVGSVGDVAGVGGTLVRLRLAAGDDADRQTERPVDRTHPLGVALREIFVDRHDVHAVAGERIQVDRQRRDERLALAGAHLGDLAVVQHHAADELDVEWPHADAALRRLAHGREGLRQQIVEFFAGREASAELHRSGRESVSSLIAASASAKPFAAVTRCAYSRSSRWLRLPKIRVKMFHTRRRPQTGGTGQKPAVYYDSTGAISFEGAFSGARTTAD